MNPTNGHIRPETRRFALVALGSACVAVLATLGMLYATGRLGSSLPTRQAMVHAQGSQVMPFDLTTTTHVFEMMTRGGVQRVVVNDPNDTAQVALIQQHLKHEAMQFSAGNFSDPAIVHGTTMPGLQELAAGAAHITVTYTALPDGAQIAYTTEDIQLVTALHQWFGAQLSDHGHDAMAQ
jgi:hypothetical protein